MRKLNHWINAAQESSRLDAALISRLQRKSKKTKEKAVGTRPVFFSLDNLEPRQMLAAAPTISPTTTPEDTTATTGLVITAGDGVTTDYEIRGLVGGTLTLRVGGTPVTNGSNITAADGSNGLDFTPTGDANSLNATFGFDVTAYETGFANASSTAAASISVTEVNDDPSFTGPAVTTSAEEAAHAVLTWVTTFNPGGGVDEAGQSAKYTVVATDPSFFLVQPDIGPSGQLSYTPATNKTGVTTFTAYVSDDGDTNGVPDSKASAVATFTISITEVNDAPTFTASTPLTVSEDTLGATTSYANWATFGTGGGADEAGQTAKYTVAVTNGAGAFSVAPAVDASGKLTYTLGKDQNSDTVTGDITFTVSVADNGKTNGVNDPLSSATQTFTLSVTEVNDAPTFTGGVTTKSVEDTSKSVTNWATFSPGGGSDESGQTATYTVVATDPTFFSVLPAVDASGTLTYTPALDKTGVTTFTVYVTDDGTTNGAADAKFSPTSTYTISVSEVNDAPTFTASTPLTVSEDTLGATTSYPNWATFGPGGGADEAGQTAKYTVAVTNGAGAFSVAPAVDANGKLTYTLGKDQNSDTVTGDITFTVSVTDNGKTNGVNDPLSSATQTFTLSVTEVNDAPTFTASTPTTVNEDATGASTQYSSWATFNPHGGSDESGQAATYTVSVTNGASAFAVAPAVDSSGKLTYTLAAHQNSDTVTGDIIFTVFVTDNGTTNTVADSKSSATQTFTLVVNPVNDQPTFETTTNSKAFPSLNDSPEAGILEDSGKHFIDNFITARDPKGNASTATDENGQTFTYFANLPVVQASTHFSGSPFATFDVDISTGKLTYTTKPNVYGTWQFTIGQQDSGGTALGGVDIGLDETAGGPVTFTLTIDPVADEPQIPVTITKEHTMSAGIPVTTIPQDYDFWPSTPTFPGHNPPVSGTTSAIVGGTRLFYITNVTNGVLYYNTVIEGSETPADEIPSGTWITQAEAAAGLKFKPWAGYYTEKGDLFGFDVQESLNGDQEFADPTAPSGFASIGPGSTVTHHDITVNRLPDFVSDTVFEFLPQTVTPGQRVFATVSWQNSQNTTSTPLTLKIYRSSDGSLATRDALLVNTTITGVPAHHGIVVPVSWIASYADADADGDNDGTASSFLIAIIDEEDRTGDGTLTNDWHATLLPDYVVTVPDITVDMVHSDLLASEGLADSGKFVFTRSGDTSLPLTIYVEWNTPVGQPPSDLTDAADFIGGIYPGILSPATQTAITFLPGFSSTSITVTPIIDTNTATSEQNTEHLIATIVPDPLTPAPAPGSPYNKYTIATLGGVEEATMDILDVVNTINIKALDASASEAKSLTAAFRLSRGNKESNKLPVTVTVDFGTPSSNYAIPTTDFLAKLGATNVTFYSTIPHPAVTLADITIPAKKNFVDFKIVPIDDVVIEGTEILTPTIQVDPNGNQAYIPGVTTAATASILDNDDIRISANVQGIPQTFTGTTNQGTKLVRFTVTVRNTGNTSSAITLQVGLMDVLAGGGATDKATYDANVLPFKTISLGAMTAGATKTKTFAVRLSSIGQVPVGTYRIVAKADANDAVLETNENDNYTFTGGIITIN